MKTFFKVIAALAAIAGAVYVVATYDDKIVAWAKKLLGQCPCCCEEDCCCEEPAEELSTQAEETDFEA